jgi:hypothetical protein
MYKYYYLEDFMNRSEFGLLLKEWLNINERTLPFAQGRFRKEQKAYFIPYGSNPTINFTKLFDEIRIIADEKTSFENTRNDALTLEKSDKTFEAIKSIMHEKYNLVDEEDLQTIQEAINSDLPVFIAYTVGNADELFDKDGNTLLNSKFEIKKKTPEEIKSIIPWVIHDLYHVFFENDYIQTIGRITDEKFSNLFPDQTNRENTSNAPGKYAKDDLADYLERMNYTLGINDEDLVASLWAYCITSLTSYDEIENLDIDEDGKEYLKEFYKNTIEKLDDLFAMPEISNTVFLTAYSYY